MGHSDARTTTWAGLALAALALAATALACLWAGGQPRSASLGVTAPLAVMPRGGAYQVERFEDGSGSYQWVGASSWLQAPNPGGPVLLRVGLISGPTGRTPIVLRASGQAYRFEVLEASRAYRVLAPPAFGERIHVALEAPTARVKRRDLGVALTGVAVAGGGALPLPFAGALLAASASAYALLRRRLALAALALLPAQAAAVLWYAAGGWASGLAAPALGAAAAACLAPALLDPALPQGGGWGLRGRLLARYLALAALLAAGWWLLLDRQIVPPVVPLGLALAAASAYLLARRSGAARWQGAGAALLLGLTLVAFQALAGWDVAVGGALAAGAGLAGLAAAELERWLPPTGPLEAPALRWERRDTLAVAALLLGSLALRLALMPAPDPVGDIELSARRMGLLHAGGLPAAYTYEGDYLPLWLYTLYGLSPLVPALGGQFFDPLPAVTRAIVKLPPVLADVATAGLMYGWARRWRGRREALLAAALYTFAPPVWINSAWWGQRDTLVMLPTVASLLLLDRGRGRLSWLLWAAALATKPQAVVITPVLAVATYPTYGVRGVLEGGGVALAALAAAAAPLLAAGQGQELVYVALTNVGRFARVSNGAYNLGYLLTGGESVPDTDLWLGLVRYKTLGFALLSGAALLVCLAQLRRPGHLARLSGAAALALAFAMLPTQIHERYLFLPLAFLALCVPLDRRYALAFAWLALSATVNIFGELRGFFPAALEAIQSSPLPFALAAANLALLAALLGGQLRAARGTLPAPSRAGAPAPGGAAGGEAGG